LNGPFENGRIDLPTLHQLVDVLRGEEVFVDGPVAFEFQNGSVNLGLDRDFDIEVMLNRCETGEAKPFLVLPLRQLRMPTPSRPVSTRLKGTATPVSSGTLKPAGPWACIIPG